MTKKNRATSEKQQRTLESQVAKRVAPWIRLRASDYDFGSWATSGSKELLRAGCVYEYARESRKLRCLFALINSARPFRGLEFLLLSFEGLRYKDALLRLGGWFGWLRNFTDHLANNKSFAELGNTNQKQLSESLEILPQYFLAPEPISPPLPPDLIEPRVLWPWQIPGDVSRPRVPDDLRMHIQIRLRDFTDKEIARAMKELVSSFRTGKAPQRKGTGKKSSTLSRLDALSAMRLASWYPISPPPRGLRSIRDGFTALDRFNEIRLGGSKFKSVDESNFREKYLRTARELVEAYLFGETAANSQLWSKRQHVTK